MQYKNFMIKFKQMFKYLYNNVRYTEEEEIMGGRYIVGNKLKEYSTEISIGSPEVNANDLRGQYLPKSSLEDSYSQLTLIKT